MDSRQATSATGQLSPDGNYVWDGTRWQSLLSPDGQSRWDGTQWQPLPDPSLQAKVSSARPAGVARRKTTRRRFIVTGAVLAVIAMAVALVVAIAPPSYAEAQLSGRAVWSRPLSGAAVNIYAAQPNGQAGALLATATTDPGGYYAVMVPHSSADALLVVTAGGVTTDIVNRQTLRAGRSDVLRTFVASGQNEADLTPLTTFAAARVTVLTAAGQPLGPAMGMSAAAVAREYNLETITAMPAAVVDSSADVQVSGRQAREVGLVLAGIDQEAHNLGVTDMALTAALARDLSDGLFDGKDGQTPILIDGSVPLPATAATTTLQDALNTFAASPLNATHVGAPQIALRAPRLDLNTAGMLYTSSAALPAWIENQFGSVTIGASGGTPPYTCALARGSLPAGFNLNANCTISGRTGLGTSVERIVGPFTVAITDSSAPPQSVTLDLWITIVQKPPTITVVDGNCPHEKQPCTVTVATAKGGTPPYRFGYGPNGFSPLGMFWNMRGGGILTGKPAKAGTYTFDVCVVDLVGASSCASTTITVGDAVSPTPPPTEMSTAPPSAPPAASPHQPAGFPTNLPAGDYRLDIYSNSYGVTSHIFMGNASISADDASALSQAIAQVASTYRSQCPACTVSYTPFNGAAFDLVIATDGYEVRLRITKI